MSTQQQQAVQGPIAAYEDVFEQLTESDLSEGSRDLLRNLVSKDLVLAYFREEEVNEMKWKLRTIQDVYIDMHPSEDCLVTGQDRAAINGDVTDTLRPLSARDIMVIDTFFTQLNSRLTRARDMKQQEMMNTQINEQRADLQSDGGADGLMGKLSR